MYSPETLECKSLQQNGLYYKDEREIGVFIFTLKANCNFTLTFRNFVILFLFYENEASR